MESLLLVSAVQEGRQIHLRLKESSAYDLLPRVSLRMAAYDSEHPGSILGLCSR